MIRDEIDAVKRNWLTQVIMSDDFASTWDAYMAAISGMRSTGLFRYPAEACGPNFEKTTII